MKILIILSEQGPAGKVADAELHFETGPLAGLKLIGFSIWQSRTAIGLNVTFPARQYTVNRERRSFALLRPRNLETQADPDRLKRLIVEAFEECQASSSRPAAVNG